MALLEKKGRDKSQDGSSVKRMLVWSDGQQEKSGADQAAKEDALWSEKQVSKRRYKIISTLVSLAIAEQKDQAHEDPQPQFNSGFREEMNIFLPLSSPLGCPL